MTDQGPLGRLPRGASVPGGAPCGAGPQLINLPDRFPSLGTIAGAVSRYLKTQGGVSKSQGQCEA